MSRASTALATSVVALGLFAAPAHAGDVTRVALGSSIEDLVVAPDGGAWVSIVRGDAGAIGRATPDGRFVATTVDDAPVSAALGPDGQAWFKLKAHGYMRSDAAGALTPLPLPQGGPVLGAMMATGPDGTLWSLTQKGDRVAHISPGGGTTYTSTRVPDCGKTEFEASGSPSPVAMARSADGAMWYSDAGCSRLIRIAATGTTQVKMKLPEPRAVAADASGGLWFAGQHPGHVDATGTVTRFAIEARTTEDVAVAADGSAWFATGRCTLTRIAPTGEVTTAPAPVPATRIGFDPAGGMWLASHARLVHLAAGEAPGTCDEQPPSVRVNLGRRSVSLRALRRAGGLRLTAREPVSFQGIALYTDDVGSKIDEFGPTTVAAEAGGTVRVRIKAKQFARFARNLKAGRRPELDLLLFATDREGNVTVETYTVRVRR